MSLTDEFDIANDPHARARALQEIKDLREQVAVLEHICEHMATEHIVFGVVGSDEKVHPDWCVQCVFDTMRTLLEEYAQWGHEEGHGGGSFEDCRTPICQRTKEAIRRGQSRV